MYHFPEHIYICLWYTYSRFKLLIRQTQSKGETSMKKLVAVILTFVCCISLAGCAKKEKLELPFSASDVESVEMFRFTVPVEAEKKVLTGQEDIEGLYTTFQGISLKDKETEPLAGGSVTSFRFNLSDGTDYEVVYSSLAVKSGRLRLSNVDKDYATSADIGACWDNYDCETVKAAENELPVL